MSDFDREAEREKLREKYERDKKKREAAEEMSELLLQGATMTNRHCPECHSPVFRYDGTQFCPTCQREITEEGEFKGEESEAAASDSEAAASSGEPADATDEPAETPASADDAAAGEPTANGETTDIAEAEPSEKSAESRPETTDERARKPEPSTETADHETGISAADRQSTETRPATTGERRPARIDPPARREEPSGERRAAGSGDLADADAALVREIANLTRQAEETRDVGRKRDLFAAAREAAETLQSVRQL